MRSKDVKNGNYTNQHSLPKLCSKDAPDFIKDYCDFYHIKRGYHPRSINSGLGWNASTMLSHLIFSLFDYVLKKLKVLFYLFMEIKVFLIMIVTKL